MKVLIIGNGLVIATGIKILLDTVDSVTTKMHVPTDERLISAEIRRYAPDVIIAEGEKELLKIFKLLITEDCLDSVRIILPDEHENRFWLCDLYQIKLASMNDLLQAAGIP